MKKTFTVRDISVRNMAICAMLAALYAALCLALAPISYGFLNVRIAEALTLTAVFSPLCVWGITLGCAVANFAGFLTGANILGPLDIVFGTAATLAAGVLSYRFRNFRFRGLPVLAAVPPVVLNALVIGLELNFAEAGGFVPEIFALYAFQVGLGQTLSCFALGLPLCYLLERAGVANKFLK